MGTSPIAWIAVALLLGPDKPLPDAVERELLRHQGTWVVTRAVFDGQESDPEIVRTIQRVVEGDHVVWRRDGQAFAGARIELDPSANPPAIDVLPDGGPSRGRRVLGIYKIEGETLTLCMAAPDQPRPDVFEAAAGSGRSLMTFRRAGTGE